MDEFLRQLTHENDLFAQQWPDTFSTIDDSSIPNETRRVLTALADYVREDQSASDLKDLLITKVIHRLINDVESIAIDDLVYVFTRCLESKRNDPLSLHFLTEIYREFELGNRLSTLPWKTNFIGQVLRSLQQQTFAFASEEIEEKWQELFTRHVFSSSITDDNVLNNETMIKATPADFQAFFRHAVQQSLQSSVWLKIAQTLHESSPEIFNNETIATGISLHGNLPIESISLNYIQHLIGTCENSPASIKTNHPHLLTLIERLIAEKRMDDAHVLFTKLIVPHLTSVDLELVLRALIRLCSTAESKDLLLNEILLPFIHKFEDLPANKQLASTVFDLSQSILTLRLLDAPSASLRLLNRRDFYPWKDLIDGLVNMVRTCTTYDTITHAEFFSPLNDLEALVEFIEKKARIYPQILRATHALICEQIIRWSSGAQTWSPFVYRMGQSMFDLIDERKINEDFCLRIIDNLFQRINSKDAAAKELGRGFFMSLGKYLGEYLSKLPLLSRQLHSHLNDLFLSIAGHPFYDEDQNMTLEYLTVANCLLKVAVTITNENDARLYQAFLGQIYIQAKEEENELLHQWWLGFWMIVGSKVPNVAIDHLEYLLDDTLNSKRMDLVHLLVVLSVQYPDRFYSYLDPLANTLFADCGKYLSSLQPLFSSIIRTHPNFVQSEQIDAIFAALETIPFSHELSLLIQSLGYVASYYPDLFDKHREKLVRLVVDQPNLPVFECLRKYLLASMIFHRQRAVKESIDVLIGLAKEKNLSDDMRTAVFLACVQIALRQREIVVERRKDLTALDATLVLNFLDGQLTRQTDLNLLAQVQVELEQIEVSIEKANSHSRASSMDLLAHRQLSLEEDQVPSWTGEVTKLLNRRTQNDWRVLGERLGYTSSELDHWAMQTDPCMALLNDWFTTHTLDEAIFSLIENLKQIGRYDAEQMIRQSVGHPVLEHFSTAITRQPPVFLSFHPNDQTFVHQVKEHLEEAGYACQMNDSSARIRGSKVALCFISTSFGQSEHCLQELDSILTMKKPVICLQIDHQVASSNTQLIQVIGEALSIRFTDDSTTKEWPEERFIEVLGRIRYHLAPNPDRIGEQYRHWFVPRLEQLIFLKSFKKQHANEFTSLANIPLVVVQPQIILSYHWNDQAAMVILYQKLTRLGYRVWLDIFQMTGEDPLLTKMTHAIEQSSCLLACITSKYLQSSSGQGELSLTNHHGKPVIPLLLEETVTWPPVGAAVSAGAERPLIDFRQANEHDRWVGKSFDALLLQLKQLIPNVSTDKPRHLLDMQRPQSGLRDQNLTEQRPKRISSAPSTPKSRACSVM